MISRAKGAQVNKQQGKKNLFRRLLLQFITKYGCGAPFKNFIYEILLSSQSSIPGNLLGNLLSSCLILEVKLMDWPVKSSPPASPP